MESNRFQITETQGQALVRLARKTLMERFNRQADAGEENRLAETLKEPTLQICCGTFVTLKLENQLRGCIGSLTGSESLVDGIKSHAVNAAFHDPRFPPLNAAELDKVIIEVSVLTEPQPLAYDDADDLIAKLRPHVDGVTLRKGFARATFLPQVWEQLSRPEDFLSHLCMKAGLDSHAWRNAHPEVEVYQVQHFEEHLV